VAFASFLVFHKSKKFVDKSKNMCYNAKNSEKDLTKDVESGYNLYIAILPKFGRVALSYKNYKWEGCLQ